MQRRKEPSRLAKSVANIDTSTNWSRIESVFSDQTQYRKEVADDIIGVIEELSEQVIGADVPIKLSIPLAAFEAYPDGQLDSAIEFVKTQFLKVLENRKLISNLKILLKYTDDDDGSEQEYVGADFSCDPQKLKEALQQLLKKHVKTVFSRRAGTIRMSGQHVYWGDKKLLFRGGLKVVMGILLEKPRIIRNGMIAQRGVLIPRKDLENAVPYRDEDAFRSALKKLRKKIKASRFPMEVINEKRNHYLLQIEYKE